MSKASQRRLAEQQKRNRKKGVPQIKDVVKTMLLGADAIYQVPLSYWRCVAMMGKARKKHIDDQRLDEFFKANRDEIEQLHLLAKKVANLAGEGLPGIAFHGCLGAGDEGEVVRYPLNASGCADHCTDEDLIEMVHQDRAECGIDEADVSLWLFGLALPGDPMVCIGVTASGARFTKMRLDKEWITGKEDHLLNRMLGEIVDTDEGWNLSCPTAHRLLMEELSAGGGVDEELDPKLVAIDVQRALDMGASPYLSLALASLEYANVIKAMTLETLEQSQTREQKLAKLERRTSHELASMKTRMALSSQRDRQDEVRKPVALPQDNGTKPRTDEPKELAARLGAFF